MKKYLDKFAVITLGCDKDGTILVQNSAAKKIAWLPKTGENFIHWSNISDLQDTYCQTKYLPKTSKEVEAIKFQIVPYKQDEAIRHLVFIFLESQFPRQVSEKTLSSETVEELWNTSSKITFSEEPLISFSECYSFFLDIFKDATFQSNVAFEDSTVYGDRSLLEKIFKAIKDIIFMNTSSSSHFTVTATHNKDRKQIVLEIKLTHSFNRIQKNKFSDYIHKIQKDLEVIQATLKIENLNFKPIILLVLNTKEQNINPLKVLVIDSYERSLKQMVKYLKTADPFVKIAAVSKPKRALSISKKEFNVIILDPHINRFKFFPYFFKKFNYVLVDQIMENQEANIIICIVFYGKLLEEVTASRFNIVDYHNKPYHCNKTKVKVQHILQTARKMETLNQDLAKAQYFSQIDKLTGLFNRRYFDTFSHRLVQEATDKNFSFALFILDVDFFKNYNDINGHAEGDVVLKKLAKLLEATLRSTDIITRLGGEEFVILSPKVQVNTGFIIAEKIRISVEKYQFKNQIKQPNKNLTVSIGIAIFPTDAFTITDLFSIADKNLYQAKEKGRNRSVSNRHKQTTQRA